MLPLRNAILWPFFISVDGLKADQIDLICLGDWPNLPVYFAHHLLILLYSEGRKSPYAHRQIRSYWIVCFRIKNEKETGVLRRQSSDDS